MKCPCLLDYVLLIGIPEDDINDFVANSVVPSRHEPEDPKFPTLLPSILDVCPPGAVIKDDSFLHSVPLFCVPRNIYISRSSALPPPKYHNFVLTDEYGAKIYGHCLKFYERLVLPAGDDDNEENEESHYHIPKCLCFLSRFAFYGTLRRLLTHLYRLYIVSPPAPGTPTPEMPLEHHLWSLVQYVLLPPPGGVTIQTQVEHTIFRFQRPSVAALPLLQVSLRHLFNTLSLRNVLLLVQAILLEQRIVVLSRKEVLLTAVCESVLSLTYPFTWDHVYIPVLPLQLMDYLQSPTPYLMGVHPDCWDPHQDGLEETLVFDLDKDAVDVESIHGVLPPLPAQEYSALLAAIRPHVHPETFYLDTLSEQAGDWDHVHGQAIRMAFVQFFVSLFGDYHHFMLFEPQKVLDKVEFMRGRRPDSREFFEAFLATMAFMQFINLSGTRPADWFERIALQEVGKPVEELQDVSEQLVLIFPSVTNEEERLALEATTPERENPGELETTTPESVYFRLRQSQMRAPHGGQITTVPMLTEALAEHATSRCAAHLMCLHAAAVLFDGHGQQPRKRSASVLDLTTEKAMDSFSGQLLKAFFSLSLASENVLLRCEVKSIVADAFKTLPKTARDSLLSPDNGFCAEFYAILNQVSSAHLSSASSANLQPVLDNKDPIVFFEDLETTTDGFIKVADFDKYSHDLGLSPSETSSAKIAKCLSGGSDRIKLERVVAYYHHIAEMRRTNTPDLIHLLGVEDDEVKLQHLMVGQGPHGLPCQIVVTNRKILFGGALRGYHESIRLNEIDTVDAVGMPGYTRVRCGYQDSAKPTSQFTVWGPVGLLVEMLQELVAAHRRDLQYSETKALTDATNRVVCAIALLKVTGEAEVDLLTWRVASANTTPTAGVSRVNSHRSGAEFHLKKIFDHLPLNTASVDMRDDFVYVGTTSGDLFVFRLTGELEYTLEHREKISNSKPITQTKLVPGINRLLLLSDGRMTVYDSLSLQKMQDLPPKKDKVFIFAVEEMGPVHRICVCTKRKLVLFNYLNAKGVYEEYLSLFAPRSPVSLKWFGTSLFMCCDNMYCLMNSETGEVQELFSLTGTYSLIQILSDDEVLLGADNLGVLVNMEGHVTRTPISWTQPPRAVGATRVYLLAVLPQYVELYRIKDLQRLERLEFPQGFTVTCGSRFMDSVTHSTQSPNSSSRPSSSGGQPARSSSGSASSHTTTNTTKQRGVFLVVSAHEVRLLVEQRIFRNKSLLA